jgi:hypothetical protein
MEQPEPRAFPPAPRDVASPSRDVPPASRDVPPALRDVPPALRDVPPPPGGARLSLLQRLSSLFRSYEIPADCVRLRGPFKRDDRRCYTVPLPAEWPSDEDGRSPVTLFEDGLPLGPAHVSHDDIRTLGRGRYSHWGAALYFSASDGTDPNVNGRVYSVLPPAGWRGALPRSPWTARDAGPPLVFEDDALLRGALHASAGESAGDRLDQAGLPSLGWRIVELHASRFVRFGGHAVSCGLHADWPSDADDVSTVLLLEDDVPLALPHALHADIAALGAGRYSHWKDTLLFSSSDGSDPAMNGRRYAAAWADALLFSHAQRPPQRESGHCHVLSALPRHWVSDDAGVSRVVLLEDGRPLGPAHAPHAEIRELGGGRLSHWRGQLWFSTSDNSDPATNGRTYAVLPVD